MTHIRRYTPRIIKPALLFTVVLALAVMRIEAHAVLKSSNPTNGAAVTGPNLELTLTFNVRIDAARSKLHLLRPDASIIDLPLDKHAPADTIGSKVSGLKPGAYTVRWQVLAPDGHITRGEIPFIVRP